MNRNPFYCRRTITALFGITCLTFLGYTGHGDVGEWIALVSLGLSGANAYEAVKNGK